MGNKKERKRIMVGKPMKNFKVDKFVGSYTGHDHNITANELQHFQPDGTHLTTIGSNLYLTNIQVE